MAILFILGLCTVSILVLVGYLKLQPWNSSAHLINADWLNTSEKFNLASRWGTQF